MRHRPKQKDCFTCWPKKSTSRK